MNNFYELPEGWRWVILGEICEIIMGQSPPGSTYIDHPEGLPFFQGKADFTEYFPKPRTWCVQPIKISLKGDILISVRAPVGPVNMNNRKCCIGRGLSAIRCRNYSVNWYIFWYLRAMEKDISSLGSGSTFVAINRRDLINFPVPLAPIEEQRRIATKIQELIQEVERIRAGCEKQFGIINFLPQKILEKAFRGKL